MENNKEKEIAVFGGGCFWCTEAVFKMLKGVESVLPGYAGGITKNPTYEQVSTGTTNHVEVVRIEYDPNVIQFKTLLTVFFATHDPTTLNKQGNDVGTQYRSAVFYQTEPQRLEALNFIKELNDSNTLGNPIVTEVTPLDNFYVAEDYHKDYFLNHPDNSYCQLVINPKLEKVQKEFSELLNKEK